MPMKLHKSRSSIVHYDEPVTELVLDLAESRWMDLASCVGMSQSTFFPNHTHEDGGMMGRDAYRFARPVCKGCPVRLKCLSHALKHNIRYGMWGGMSPDERDSYKRKLRRRK